ncbi:very long-chain acyl-CoA synthetase isoform X1 [Salarias fasciatus]|uniref:very long-chain acyl-CoA synthetase isoform X1 n=1 Tax=Salarias fasciatus TaxID=181472 RepID=UPI001176C454|nr:very long-chain acyl-CoA synthetase-like isoform X1 [Salarias fasciatus]
MLTVLLSSALAALLALLLYQRTFLPFLWQDARFYLRLRGFSRTVQSRMRSGVLSLADCLARQASRAPDRPFVVFGERTWTYGEVDRRSNRFARALRAEAGLRPGAVAALLMSNEPDFLCAWFGLSRLGCQAAFINVHLKPAALLHCLLTCGASTLLLGADLLPLVQEVRSELQKQKVCVWVVDHTSPSEDFHTLLDKVDAASGEPLTDAPKVQITSNFLYIFTSGTTGLSKAARVGHLKAIASMAFFHICGATSEDVIYITLPLYHMSASLLGIGGCIHLGATCVLKKKFSARQFWPDCVKHKVTVVQYIGELCRYLLNQPPVPEEKLHRVRLAAGSGLRPDVWRKFVSRFGSIRVREGYGLTEAGVGFLNYTDEVGPIGRAGYFNKLSMPFELLRFDPHTFEAVRTPSGRCLKAEAGEAGILVAPLTARNQFSGYAGNQQQSEKKLLRDVFQPGDVYFNTGDLLLRDHRDFLYFRDRVGDTFRWKGENVSTMEVSEVLGLLPFIQEANVYGVTVPGGSEGFIRKASEETRGGSEGRAGMAAVVLKQDHSLDGEQLYRQLEESLPAYAWPWFVRIQTSLDVTDTFKQQKTKLVQEGFNPQLTGDPLLFLDASQKTFVPLNSALYEDIVSGNVRF